MQISSRGIDFIKRWESYVPVAYLDVAGIPTVGYGTTMIDGERVKLGMMVTPEQAEQYLAADCASAERVVNKVTQYRSLSQSEFDALVSFTYNIGNAGFEQSTLRRKLVEGEPVVEDYFLRWNKITSPTTGKLVVSAGLTNRRKSEYAFFATTA